MTSSILTELLQSFSILSLFLLIGTFLRAKISILQKLFLPASVIGGFLGLMISPEIIKNYSPIPENFIKIYSIIPGILIVPIFAAIPLGMFMESSNENKSAMFFKSTPAIIKAFGIFMAASMSQSAAGYITNIFFTKTMPNINMYRTFGYELSAGFSGGHGLAAATGKLLEGFGLAYYEVAQGVAVTEATIGLIGGMVIGIVFINIAIRKSKIKPFEAEIKNIDKNLQRGFYSDISKQTSLGRETFFSASIETITFHIALILVVSGIAYIVLHFAKLSGIKGLSVLPVWTYSMIIMFLLNFIIKKLNLSWMIDSKVKTRITGTLSDFAIIAAIISLPVYAVSKYMLPIIVMSSLGFITTIIIIYFLTSIFFKNDYTFERFIVSFGTATGVLITGMMLLKICDKDYKTPALKDFSLGFSLMSISGLVTVPVLNSILATGSTMMNFIAAFISVIIFMFIAFLGYLAGKRTQ